MKLRLLAVLILLYSTSCKKEKGQQNMISFDFGGTHHAMAATAHLMIFDIGNDPGKYLFIHTDSSITPVVSILIRENVTDHSLSNFATLTYPSMVTNIHCTDTLNTSSCLGFKLGYFDNSTGALGTYLHVDTFSVMNVVGASGTPSILNCTFTALLVDSASNLNPQKLTNGLIWDLNYDKR